MKIYIELKVSISMFLPDTIITVFLELARALRTDPDKRFIRSIKFS
jgi:hypothetical protein